MNERFDQIVRIGRSRGETPRAALRHYLLEGILRRIALTCEGFVLRGGLLTRAWIAPLTRPTRDLDLVGDFPFSVSDTARRFRPVLTQPFDDGVVIAPESFASTGIWLDSEFPGVRIALAIGYRDVGQELTLDIGFGDPLIPQANTFRYDPMVGDPFPVRAVRAETQVGWKLHGLAEMGESWRPKDLADLWFITRRVQLNPIDLVAAIEAAFVSRRFEPAQATTILEHPHWTTKTARVRWANVKGLPELAQTLREVRRVLAPALTQISNN